MAESLEVRRATTSVSVDIYDQTYHLRAPDPEYIQKLAATVDAKMRAVSANGNTVDSLRVAVLAALNIADELMRLQEHCRLLRGTMSETPDHSPHPRQQSLRPAGLCARPRTPLSHIGSRRGGRQYRVVTCQSASLTLASIQRPACKAGAAVNAG